MSWGYDDDAQPTNLSLNWQRLFDAGIDELSGLLRGIAADRKITKQEVESLCAWLVRHQEIAEDWPAKPLIQRIRKIIEDGTITDEECADLLDLVDSINGECENPCDHPVSTLPLTRPAPEVIFHQNVFVFTGKFLYGPRRVCQLETLERGGVVKESITLQTDYLVLGSVGSRDWKHGSFGNKIAQAVDFQAQRLGNIRIVSEKRWAEFLLPAK